MSDEFRKPETGMWRFMADNCNGGKAISEPPARARACAHMHVRAARASSLALVGLSCARLEARGVLITRCLTLRAPFLQSRPTRPHRQLLCRRRGGARRRRDGRRRGFQRQRQVRGGAVLFVCVCVCMHTAVLRVHSCADSCACLVEVQAAPAAACALSCLPCRGSPPSTCLHARGRPSTHSQQGVCAEHRHRLQAA